LFLWVWLLWKTISWSLCGMEALLSPRKPGVARSTYRGRRTPLPCLGRTDRYSRVWSAAAPQPVRFRQVARAPFKGWAAHTRRGLLRALGEPRVLLAVLRGQWPLPLPLPLPPPLPDEETHAGPLRVLLPCRRWNGARARARELSPPPQQQRVRAAVRARAENVI
jgi:hypothetical protein